MLIFKLVTNHVEQEVFVRAQGSIQICEFNGFTCLNRSGVGNGAIREIAPQTHKFNMRGIGSFLRNFALSTLHKAHTNRHLKELKVWLILCLTKPLGRRSWQLLLFCM